MANKLYSLKCGATGYAITLKLAVMLLAVQVAVATINPIGCFIDSSNRLLNGLSEEYGHDFPNSYQTSAGMTPESCGNFCGGLGFSLSGVEAGNQCFCGSHQPLSMTAGTCDTPCFGDASETCGGTYALQMYRVTPPVNPAMCTICSMSCDWCSFDPEVFLGCAVTGLFCASGIPTGIFTIPAAVCAAVVLPTCGVAIGSVGITCAIAKIAGCQCSNLSQYCG